MEWLWGEVTVTFRELQLHNICKGAPVVYAAHGLIKKKKTLFAHQQMKFACRKEMKTHAKGALVCSRDLLVVYSVLSGT